MLNFIYTVPIYIFFHLLFFFYVPPRPSGQRRWLGIDTTDTTNDVVKVLGLGYLRGGNTVAEAGANAIVRVQIAAKVHYLTNDA